MNKLLICLLISAQLVTYLSATEEACAAGVSSGGLAVSSMGVSGVGVGLARGAAARNAAGAGLAGSNLASRGIVGAGLARGAAGVGASRAAAGAAAGAAETGAAERVVGAVETASIASADQAGAAKVAANGVRVATATLTDAARKVALQIVLTANSAESKVDAAATDSNAAIRKAAKAIDGVVTGTIRNLQQTVDTIVLGLQGSVKKTTSQINMALDSAIIGVSSDLYSVIAAAEQTVAKVGRGVALKIREAATDYSRGIISSSVGFATTIGKQGVQITTFAEGARQDVRASQAGMMAMAAAANAHYGTGIPVIPK